MLSISCFNDSFLTVSYEQSKGWIYAQWKGYQTEARVKEGCEQMLKFMLHYKVDKMLCDTRGVLGIWMSASAWLAEDWFPRAKRAGMKNFALIYGESRMSRASADAAAMILAPEDRKLLKGFYDIREAEGWLA